MPDTTRLNGHAKETPAQSHSFHNLVQELRITLGPSSGINSDDVNSASLQKLMREYQSNPSEWAGYAFQDLSRNYTRNLVDRGNGKCNLVREHVL